MTYEYYKSNYNKLTKQERNSNKEFQRIFLEAAHHSMLQQIKKNMDERLNDCNSKKEH